MTLNNCLPNVLTEHSSFRVFVIRETKEPAGLQKKGCTK